MAQELQKFFQNKVMSMPPEVFHVDLIFFQDNFLFNLILFMDILLIFWQFCILNILQF